VLGNHSLNLFNSSNSYHYSRYISNCDVIAKKIHHILTQLDKVGAVIKQYMDHNLNFSKLVSDAGDKLRFRKSHDVEANIYEQIKTITSVASRFIDENMMADVKKYISHFDDVKTPKKRGKIETTTPDTCAPSDFVLFQKSPLFTTATSSGSMNSGRSLEEDDDKSILMDILGTQVVHASNDVVRSSIESNELNSARKKQKFNDSSNEFGPAPSAGVQHSQQSSQESDKGTLCDSNENYTANITNIRNSTQGSEEDVILAPDFRTDSTGVDI